MKNFNVAWLTTNRSCNNNCTWCYAKNTLHNPNIMDISKAKLAVDELKRRNVKRIVLIGGEPTIYPHFFELISYIHKNDIGVVIASNGRMFSDLRFAKMAKDAGADKVDVSIKAIDKDTYFNNTHADGLHEMIQGYHNLIQVGISTTASFVIINDKKDDFDKLIDFLEAENFSSISFQFVKPTLSLKETDKIMPIDKMGKFVSYIYERMNKTNIKYGMEISFPICLIDEVVLKELISKHIVKTCCHVPKGLGLNLDENFKVIPCNHFAEFPFSDSIDFSNPNALDDIMDSEIVAEFRHKARSYPTVKCQTCDKWNICGGGCFTRWLTEDPNIYVN